MKSPPNQAHKAYSRSCEAWSETNSWRVLVILEVSLKTQFVSGGSSFTLPNLGSTAAQLELCWCPHCSPWPQMTRQRCQKKPNRRFWDKDSLQIWREIEMYNILGVYWNLRQEDKCWCSCGGRWWRWWYMMMVMNYDSKKNDGWWMCKTNQVNDRWPGLLWVLMQPSCCFSSSDLISGCNKSTYYSLWWQYSGKETMVTCTGIHFLWNSSSTDDVTWFPSFSKCWCWVSQRW